MKLKCNKCKKRTFVFDTEAEMIDHLIVIHKSIVRVIG